jgi:hypothetical protein
MFVRSKCGRKVAGRIALNKPTGGGCVPFYLRMIQSENRRPLRDHALARSLTGRGPGPKWRPLAAISCATTLDRRDSAGP